MYCNINQIIITLLFVCRHADALPYGTYVSVTAGLCSDVDSDSDLQMAIANSLTDDRLMFIRFMCAFASFSIKLTLFTHVALKRGSWACKYCADCEF